MTDLKTSSLVEHFTELEDPRIERTKLYQLTKGLLLAMDGKAVRRSHDQDRQKRPLHSVSVWAAVDRVVLVQTEVDAAGNEFRAIPELLQMLAMSGCIVTIDATGCQKSIVQLLTEGGADYVLALTMYWR